MHLIQFLQQCCKISWFFIIVLQLRKWKCGRSICLRSLSWYVPWADLCSNMFLYKHSSSRKPMFPKFSKTEILSKTIASPSIQASAVKFRQSGSRNLQTYCYLEWRKQTSRKPYQRQSQRQGQEQRGRKLHISRVSVTPRYQEWVKEIANIHSEWCGWSLGFGAEHWAHTPAPPTY